jgi:mycothiol synthase
MEDSPALDVRLVSSETERHEARAFARDQKSVLGRPALSEQSEEALGHENGDRAATIVARGPSSIVGLAQLHRERDWELETVVAPTGEVEMPVLARRLIEAAVAYVAALAGGTLHYWIHGLPEAAGPDEVPLLAGFRLGRELLEMRVALPLPPAVVGRAQVVPLRSFRPGQDEEAWLGVNNRAFAEHPEQGAWDLPTLLDREAREWFDPADFLLTELDGRLAAFCWTKVHRDHWPPMGEIYVIAVDPDFAGRGLGRSLTVAGLEHLAGLDLGIGMLYVDAANEAAVALYRSLGFEVHQVERAYVRTVGGD